MVESARDDRFWRYVAAGSISFLGCGLLIIPLFDIWGDVTRLSWSVTLTLLENSLFFMLSGALVGGGLWLIRSDLETGRVIMVARRTLMATALVAALIGWAAFTQLVAMHSLKPAILAADGVLVGVVASFGLSVSSVRANVFEEAASQERELSERLELLYRAASDLEGATSHEEAYDIIEQAVGEVVSDATFLVVVDDEVVVNHGNTDAAPGTRQPTVTVSIGHRGQIELLGGPFDDAEVTTVELFGSYLADTIQRIEREEALRDERDILEFVNRTLRHDLMGDFSVVQARLRMLDRNADLDERHAEHLAVALDRVEEMDEFIDTMRTYMQSVLAEDHTLEAVAPGPIIDDHVETLRRTHPEVEITCANVPEVPVMADDLLDRVVVNLLTNAVEHNDSPTPEVVVDGERLDDVVRIRVADNGPGISTERRESIFEQGERGAKSDGSGFGLYLVKDVVESYGGAVRVRDNEPRGTVFEVDLPVADGD